MNSKAKYMYKGGIEPTRLKLKFCLFQTCWGLSNCQYFLSNFHSWCLCVCVLIFPLSPSFQKIAGHKPHFLLAMVPLNITHCPVIIVEMA